MSIKDMVKDKKVTFLFYKEGELWYETECKFQFPVPINDTGTGCFNKEDKAILFMRWIRKQLDVVEGIERERSEFQKKVDDTIRPITLVTHDMSELVKKL